MKITVVICTFNRCESLARALASAACLTVPASVAWEVLVVNNNSTDQTRDVVEEFARRHPGRFRYLFEPRPGKSYALGTGIREALGDVLAFIDDDVTVEPTWLQNLTGSLHNGNWIGAGGRILPRWNSPPPSWLLPDQPWAVAPLAIFDKGPEPGPLYEPPFGTNMAFYKSVFERYGGFRTDLGPRPGCEIRNEDTEFGRRLLEAGEQIRYEPTAVVYHEVPRGRASKRYFLTWWYDKGRADTREFGIPTDTKWFVAGVPHYLYRRVVVWTLRWMFTLRPSSRFYAKLKLWGILGMMNECYHLSRRRSPSTAAVSPSQ